MHPRVHPLKVMGQFIWRITVSTTKHDITSLGSVIAFYAFFSLFPLLMLMIYAASVLAPNMNMDKILNTMVHPYFPALHQATEDFIQQNISRLAELGARVGLVSAVTLVWSATSGFIAVQQAMDVILEIHEQRSFLTRRLISFLMLLVLLLLTLGSAIVMFAYQALKDSPVLKLHFLQWFFFVHGLSRILFPMSLFLGCVVFYRFLPSKPMRWSCVIPGAAVSAVALDVGRQIFVWYASHLYTYQLIYGTLATVMLLVLWMYIASIVMLFGAEVAAALQAQMTKT